MVRIEVGQGGMILIADSYFLLNENLENMDAFYEGNIEFLRKLLAELGVGSGVEAQTTDTEDRG